MSERTVTIRLSARDEYSAVFRAYQQAVGQAASETRQFNNASSSSADGMNNLASAVGDAVKGFIAYKAVGMVADMVRLGQAANATQATFTALSGGAEEAARGLQLMRDATGGIVADTELMAGANRLLAMRLANSGEQAAQLSAIAVNLGRAFGQDASSAIENFSLMIANQSFLRLDSLGISAAAVRARMAELKEEFPEMDKQARFTQATLEEGTKNMDRLGDSIKAAQTPLTQLETRFENFKTTIGQSLANTINTAITSFEQLGTIMSTKWDEFTAEHPGAGNSAGATFWNDNQTKFQNEQYAKAREQLNDAKVIAQQQSELLRFQAIMNNTIATNAASVNPILSQLMGGRDLGSFHPVSGGLVTDMNNYGFDMFGGGGRQTPQDYANDKLYQFQTNTGDMGKFLDPAVFDDIKTRFEELQQLNEQGLISDDSLAKAEEFKNQAEAAANAFKNMSLTDIFGQSSGGMQGQIGDMVIAKMRENGASDEAIANAQRTFNLGSGRETAASVTMQDKIAPMIASLPADQAEKAIENVNAFLEAAAKMNMTPEQIANMLPGAAGFTAGAGSGQQFTISPGQTPGEVARDLKISVDQLLEIVGAPNARSVQPGTYSLGTGYSPIPNFNPASYAQGYGPQMGAGLPNPMVAAGFMTQGAFDTATAAHGENAGAQDPTKVYKEMEDSSSGLFDNMAKVADTVGDMMTKADTFNNTLDLAAKSREMVFTVNVKDNTKGLLELMLNAKQFATLSFASDGAGGGSSVRDRGGNASSLGVSPSASQRPGFSSTT